MQLIYRYFFDIFFINSSVFFEGLFTSICKIKSKYQFGRCHNIENIA